MDNLRNLLEETIRALREHGHTLNDIVWVGSIDFFMPIEDFIKLADVEYDPGFGAVEVVQDLLVVGKDWWLERHEYDGSEWFEYKTIPQKPEQVLKVKRLLSKGVGWETLKEANMGDDDEDG